MNDAMVSMPQTTAKGAAATTANANVGCNNNNTPSTQQNHATPPPYTKSKSVARPLVTDEKAAFNAAATMYNEDYAVSATCPDGSVVHLSASKDTNGAASSRVIIGRGKVGIPSSVTHISRQACVLRIVDRCKEWNNILGATFAEKGQYALELTVLGSQPCRVSRSPSHNKFIFAKSISQILASDHEFSPSAITINDGDIIEPYERPADCTIDQAKQNGVYYPFKICITKTTTANDAMSNGVEEIIDCAAFAEASRMIDMAAQQEQEISYQSLADDGSIESKEKRVEEEDSESINTNNQTQETLEIVSTVGMLVTAGDAATVDVINEKELNETSKLTDQRENPADQNEDAVTINAAEEPDGAIACFSEPAKDDFASNPTPTMRSEMNPSKTAAAEPAKPSTLVGNESMKHCSPVEVPKRDALSSSEESSVRDIPKGDAYHEIMEILGKVSSPGTFAVGGSCNGKLLMPGLMVDGVGTIGLPLSESQANELSKRCEQAPFGRGSDTVNDKSFRNAFQLKPDHFRINDPCWNKELDNLTKQVCEGLGVQAHLKVEAQLHKLLLYEEGSFFAPYRDNEKVKGMFGTLVIVLPSQFTGGDLVVQHCAEGEMKTFEQAAPSSFGSQYAAFYADCKHELKRVNSGHRLCLVYNLVKVGYGYHPRAVDRNALVNRLKTAAHQWEEEYTDNKIIIMTKHNYTPAERENGSGSSKYNGDAASMVELLDMAIEQGAKVDFDHGTVSLTETGTGEGGCGDYNYRNHWDKDDQSYEWGETLERDLSLTLSTWGESDIGESNEEMLEEYFEDQEPADTMYEPTGYDGVNAERRYADAEAIVIWPRSQRWKIATNNDTSRMCNYLLKACASGNPDSEPREACLQKANVMISLVCDNEANVKALMKCILMLGDAQLGKKFLKHMLAKPKNPPHALLEHMQALLDLLGVNAVSQILVASINVTRFSADPTGTARFLIECRKTLGLTATNAKHTEKLIEAFVDSMCPPEKKDVRVPLNSVASFPLAEILDLFVCGKHIKSGAMAKRVLEGYIWMSCQRIQVQSQNYLRRTHTREPAEGPKLLKSASLSIVSICERFGWTYYEDVLIESTEKLCLHGNANCAVAIVEKITTTPPGVSDTCDQSRICARMASITCEDILTRCQLSFSNQNSGTLATFKNLVRLIGSYCPSLASRFVEAAKTVNVDLILYPLVTDRALKSSATNSMKASLGLLTIHCAQILKGRASVNVGKITVWSLPNANLSRNSAYSSFLCNPCRKIYDWQVRKTDHRSFLQDLGPLIHLGDVKAESYQPRGIRGAWHFKITKLKSYSVPISSLNSLTCSCSNGNSSQYPYKRHLQTGNCRLKQHKSAFSKYTEDQKKWLVVKSLLTVEQRNELERKKDENRKRPSSTASNISSASTANSIGIINNKAQRQTHSQHRAKKAKTPSTLAEVVDLT